MSMVLYVIDIFVNTIKYNSKNIFVSPCMLDVVVLYN